MVGCSSGDLSHLFMCEPVSALPVADRSAMHGPRSKQLASSRNGLTSMVDCRLGEVVCLTRLRAIMAGPLIWPHNRMADCWFQRFLFPVTAVWERGAGLNISCDCSNVLSVQAFPSAIGTQKHGIFRERSGLSIRFESHRVLVYSDCNRLFCFLPVAGFEFES
jgi:hypothetical protein